MAAANFRSEFVFARLVGNNSSQFREIVQKHVGRLDHLHRKGRINDIAAGEPEMKPAAGGMID